MCWVINSGIVDRPLASGIAYPGINFDLKKPELLTIDPNRKEHVSVYPGLHHILLTDYRGGIHFNDVVADIEPVDSLPGQAIQSKAHLLIYVPPGSPHWAVNFSLLS